MQSAHRFPRLRALSGRGHTLLPWLAILGVAFPAFLGLAGDQPAPKPRQAQAEIRAATAKEASKPNPPDQAPVEAEAPAQTPLPDPLYNQRPGSFDGIGKWFMGREIAHYMSHQGAPWLERPERVEEEQPEKLLEELALKPGQVVADIGAGSGYFTWRLARDVGPTGKVYATDIQPEMLAILNTNMTARGLKNVQTVLGTTTAPNLPADTIDLALMVDVYHEFDHPYEMVREIVRALKPGGRLVFIEYRGEERWIPIKPLHKMTESQVRKEMSVQELDWVETIHTLPRQHIVIFKRREPAG